MTGGADVALDQELSGGYGASLASSSGDLWVAATTNVAHVWHGTRVAHSVDVTGFQTGRPGIADHGATLRVGLWNIDVASGEVTGGPADVDWLTDAIDDGSVSSSDFSTPVVAHVLGSSLAVVQTQYLKPRGKQSERAKRYGGPKGQLLLVDVVAGSVVSVLVDDLDGGRVIIDTSSDLVVATHRRHVDVWSSGGDRRGEWEVDEIVEAVAISPEGLVTSLDRAGTISMFTPGGDRRHSWAAHDGHGAALAWHRSGGWLASGSTSGDVVVWPGEDADGERTAARAPLGGYVLPSLAGLVSVGEDQLVVASGPVDQAMVMLAVRT